MYPAVVATPVGHNPLFTSMTLLPELVVETLRTPLEFLLVAVRIGAAATA